MATPIKWEEADFKWDIAPPSEDYKEGFKASSFPYTWDDVALIEEVVETIHQGGGVIEDDMPWLKDQDKKLCINYLLTNLSFSNAILN